MTRRIKFTFGIYFWCLNYFIVCKSEYFAFTGCNATLEWNLRNKSSKLKGVTVRIYDPTGNVIVATKNDQCTSRDNLSVSCLIYQKNEDWIIALAVINITTKHSGNYTAWTKEELYIETRTKQLIVIDTPQIREIGKPIHHRSFAVMCTTSYVSDCLSYSWKLNGADLNYTRHLHVNSSILTYTIVTMMDNLSKLVCEVGIENCGSVGCNCCSEVTEAYTVLPYYGPNKVSLTITKSDIYLQENETFRVKCSANCYPDCTFRWESFYINVDEEELVINSFIKSMSGAYICTALNQETGVTSKSYPIFLHHAKSNYDASTAASSPGDNGDLTLKQHWIGWIGPGVVSVFLLVVGSLIFVTQWRKNASKRIYARKLPDAENYRRQCSMRWSAKRSRLIKLLTKVHIENKAANEDYDIGTQSRDLNNTRQEIVEPRLQEAMYSTVDENALSFYDYARGIVIKGNSHATESSSKHGYYDYAPFKEMCHVETADVHATDENYITPINDPVCPIEVCANGTTDVLGIDQTYITAISDHACPINICQGVETNVLNTDENYITPITE